MSGWRCVQMGSRTAIVGPSVTPLPGSLGLLGLGSADGA